MGKPYERDWEPQDDFMDDFDAPVRGAYFGFRSDYMDGTRLLAVLPLIVEGMDKPVDAIYSLGDGWMSSEDGRTCSNLADPDKIPGKNSLYGKLLVRVGKDLRSELEAKKVDLRERGSSKDGRVWEGMMFHWKRESIVYKGKAFEDKGGQIESSHLMPTKFLGLETTGTAGAKASSVAAATKASGDAEEKLAALFASSPTLQQFQISAMQIPDVVSDERLRTHVLDVGPSGYWAQHKK